MLVVYQDCTATPPCLKHRSIYLILWSLSFGFPSGFLKDVALKICKERKPLRFCVELNRLLRSLQIGDMTEYGSVIVIIYPRARDILHSVFAEILRKHYVVWVNKTTKKDGLGAAG
uniref:Uncharacterized protein n=1 Tax=Glossina pallidipes TaxID=7398 RepID=A0A1A9ZMY7_GLOPL